MYNLSTDAYKVSIGAYFSALCGDKKALRKVKFIYTGRTANFLACEALTDAIGKHKKDRLKENELTELIEIIDEIQQIATLINVFDAKGYLPENLFSIAQEKFLADNGYFEVEKAISAYNFLKTKQMQLLFELKPKEITNEIKLTKKDLNTQISAINHAGGSMSLSSPVAEYFAEIEYAQKLTTHG